MERDYRSKLMTQQGIVMMCENCGQVTRLNNLWEEVDGLDHFCSLVGDKCFYPYEHHTHNVCGDCLEKRNSKGKGKRSDFLHEARQFAHVNVDREKEKYIIRRNRREFMNEGLYSDKHQKYRNYCENCFGKVNINSNNSLIFAFPLNCSYARTEIVTCKVCFSLLAEEHFQEISTLEEEVVDEREVIPESPIPWECCGEIQCTCHEETSQLSYPSNYPNEEREGSLENSSQTEDENFNNNYPVPTPAYTYTFQELNEIYAENISIKQVIANQPIERGGSKCTFECDIENHHIHTYCKNCKRNLQYGLNIHDCEIGIEFGKIHPDMKSDFLINTPWWKEPEMLQQHNETLDNGNIIFA